MSTKQLEKMVLKLSEQVAMLQTTMRSIVRVQKKTERFNPEFVKHVRAVEKNRGRGQKFTNSKAFLKLIS